MSHASFLPDAALARRAVARDAAAVGETVERFAPGVYDVATLLTADPALAARLTVDALVALGAGDLPPSQPRRALLLAVAGAARMVATRQRERRRRAARGAELGAVLATLPGDDVLLLLLAVRHTLPDRDIVPLVDLPLTELQAARARALDRFQAATIVHRAHANQVWSRGMTRGAEADRQRHIAGCQRCRDVEAALPEARALLATDRPQLSRELLDDLRFRVASALPALNDAGDIAAAAPAKTVSVPAPGAPPASAVNVGSRTPRRALSWPSLSLLASSATAVESRRPSLGLLVVVAVLAVVGALLASRSLSIDAPVVTESSPVAVWPTLPARPLPTRDSPPSLAAQPANTPPPTVTAQIAPTGTPLLVQPGPAATVTPLPAPRAPEPTAPPVVAANPTSTPASFAAARGAPVPAPPAPRTIGPPPGAAPTPSTGTASPTAAGTLRVTSTDLAFGVETGPRTIEFTNAGAGPVAWQAIGDSTWLTILPASGVLAAGESARLAVTVDRGALPTGAYTGAVELRSPAGADIVSVGMVVSPTRASVTTFDAPATPINAAGCASPTTLPVAVEVTADAPPRQVTAYYSLNGGTEQRQELTAAGKRYATVLGEFNEPGAVTYSFVITEAGGTISRTSAQSVTVQDCPSRVRRIPVTLPASRRFALAGNQHDMYTFTIAEPGNLIAQLSWSGSASRLSTLLYGPRHANQPYEQRTGAGTLTFSFPVSAADVAAGGAWALHVVNYEAGDASGTIVLTFEPAGAPIPGAAPTPPPASPPPAATPVAPGGTPSPDPATPATTPRPATPTPAAPTGTPAVTPSPTPSPSPSPPAPPPTSAPPGAPSPTGPPPTATPPP